MLYFDKVTDCSNIIMFSGVSNGLDKCHHYTADILFHWVL